MRRLLRKFVIVAGILVLALAVVAAASVIWMKTRPAIPSAAWDALSDADTYEVWAIDGGMPEGHLDAHTFYGKTAVTDLATRSALNDALERGAKESKGWTALCFEPHHGVRTTRRGFSTDFVICFKCLRVQVWQNGRQTAGFGASDSAQPAFDRVLEQAGIKPPKTTR